MIRPGISYHKNIFPNKSNLYKMSLSIYWYFFYNSLIKHGVIHWIVRGYVDLYFLLFKTIKGEHDSSQEKIDNNFMNENICSLKASSLKQTGAVFENH